jgi:hypothetical protein
MFIDGGKADKCHRPADIQCDRAGGMGKYVDTPVVQSDESM